MKEKLTLTLPSGLMNMHNSAMKKKKKKKMLRMRDEEDDVYKPPAVEPEDDDMDGLVVEEKEERVDANDLGTLLTNLKKEDVHRIFWFPVTDKIVPGYSTIIRHPMDIQTIRRKLKSNRYQIVRQFLHDVDLMFSNAKQFNPEHTIFHQEAIRLQAYTNLLLEAYHNDATILYAKKRGGRPEKKRRGGSRKTLPLVVPKPIVEQVKEEEDEVTTFEETHDFDAAYTHIIDILQYEDVKGVFRQGYYDLHRIRGKIGRGVYRKKDPQHSKFQKDVFSIFERCLEKTHHNSSMNKQGKRLLVLAKQLVYDAFFPTRKPPSFFDIYGKKPTSFDDLMVSKTDGLIINGQFQYKSNDVYNFPALSQEQLIKLCFAMLARLRSEDHHGAFAIPMPKENVDYYSKIADPLDFQLIDQRIRTHRYTTFCHFFRDLDVCFANARHYHAKTTSYHKDGHRLALLLRQLVSDVDVIMTSMGSLPPIQWDLPAMVGPCPKTEAMHMRRGKYCPPFMKEKLMRYTTELLAGDRHLPWSPIKDAVNRASFATYNDYVAACQGIIESQFNNEERLVTYAKKRFSIDRETIAYYDQLPDVCDKFAGRKPAPKPTATQPTVQSHVKLLDATKKLVAAKMAEAKRSATAAAVAVAGDLETCPLERQFVFIRPRMNPLHVLPPVMEADPNPYRVHVRQQAQGNTPETTLSLSSYAASNELDVLLSSLPLANITPISTPFQRDRLSSYIYSK